MVSGYSLGIPRTPDTRSIRKAYAARQRGYQSLSFDPALAAALDSPLRDGRSSERPLDRACSVRFDGIAVCPGRAATVAGSPRARDASGAPDSEVSSRTAQGAKSRYRKAGA